MADPMAAGVKSPVARRALRTQTAREGWSTEFSSRKIAALPPGGRLESNE